MAEELNPRRVKTAPFRMSFPHLLEPREDAETKRKTYQLTMLFPPGTDLAPLKAALKAAMAEKYGADTSKWPKLKRGQADVIRDFAEYNASRDKPMPGDWKGWTMVRANSGDKFPPGIVGPVKGQNSKFPVVTDAREIYAGRWARATIDAFVYERKDGKGVTFGLSNVQLLKHDTKFGGAVSAPEQDFDDAPEEWSAEDDNWDGQEAKNANDEPWN